MDKPHQLSQLVNDLAANILNKQSWTVDQEWSSSCKYRICSETSHRASEVDRLFRTTLAEKNGPERAVSYIKGGAQAKGIRKQDPEANIWTQEG